MRPVVAAAVERPGAGRSIAPLNGSAAKASGGCRSAARRRRRTRLLPARRPPLTEPPLSRPRRTGVAWTDRARAELPAGRLGASVHLTRSRQAQAPPTARTPDLIQDLADRVLPRPRAAAGAA